MLLALQDYIVRFMLEAGMSLEDFMGTPGAQVLDAEQQAYILAARGCLALGLMQHTVQKRHLVTFGVNRHVGLLRVLGFVRGNLAWAF